MTMGESGSSIDPSLLELFRSDVAMHWAALEAALLSMKEEGTELEKLDTALDAMFAIRGAAQIVGLDAVDEFAGALHEKLAAFRKGAAPHEARHVDALLEAGRLLGNLADASAEEIEQWPGLYREKIDEIFAGFSEAASIEVQDFPELVDEADAEPEPPLALSEPEPPAPEKQALMVDPVMLDIFRTEVAGNAEILSGGLLVLESEPAAATGEILDGLMRAAHSIKGAGRIVNLDQMVRLAHAIEDCFVATRKGEISLFSQDIDVLLKATDVLVSLSELADESSQDLTDADDFKPIEDLVRVIRAISTGEHATEPVAQKVEPPAALPVESQASSTRATQTLPVEEVLPARADDLAAEAALPSREAVPPQVAHSPGTDTGASGKPSEAADRSGSMPSQEEPGDKKRMIRVAAKKIERLIGLAGEVVVNTRWLPQFSDSLLALKKNQVEMAALLERLQEALASPDSGRKAADLVYRARENSKRCSQLVADRMSRLNSFTSSTTTLSDRLYQEAIGVRMRPFAEGSEVRGLPRMVRDLARSLGKKARFEISGRSTEVDRDILEKLDAPLNHLIRNAVDHGIETPEEREAAGKPVAGTIKLQVEHRSGMLMIKISDDGRGIDMAELKAHILTRGLASAELVERLSEPELMDFLFLPGFSTARKVTEISGRGVGLDVVHTMVHEVGGVIRAFSKKGEGITFAMELPLTLSVIRTLLVTIAREAYAFPLARIDRCLQISSGDVLVVEDRQYFRYDGKNIALVNIHRVLDIAEPEGQVTQLSIVVVNDRTDAYGLVVDGFLGECDLVVRPLDSRLGKVANFSAAALLLDGTPVLIFDVDDLLCSINSQLSGKRLASVAETEATEGEKARKHVLVVDDSITVRELERKMLEHKGYQVDVAVDGMDGWNAVRSGHYDMVVSDVDMPRMNGIEMITLIRQHPDLKSLPVIIVSYKDKEEDKLAGLQAGANYYLTKSSFQDLSFINAVVDLIGEPDDTNSNS